MLNDRHVSLDIEACGEVLLSLGAVEFDPRSGRVTTLALEANMGEFYGVPSIEGQLARGLKIDAGAWRWLLEQPDAARMTIAKDAAPAEVVLSNFCAWYARRADAWCWAYPTSFDLPVIERACRAFGIRPPWKWTKTLDGRTLWRLACQMDPSLEKIEKEANPSPHHALEDAKAQARWFAKYLVPIVGGAPAGERK